MELEIRCDNCGHTVFTGEKNAGRSGKCPECEAPFEIPAINADEPDPPIVPNSDGEPAPAAIRSRSRHSREQQNAASNNYSLLAVGAAGGAAIVGAIAWAVIAVVTDYEIGFMAWGIGAAVGFAALAAGGRGQTMALVCAVLALLSIFCGKCLSMHFLINKELKSEFTLSMYEESKTDAQDFAALPEILSDEAIRTFMFDHAYTVEEVSDDIADEDLEIFRTAVIPRLRSFNLENPGFEEWQNGTVKNLMGSVSLPSLVIENIDGIDLLFAALGILTALGFVIREGENRDRETRRSTRRQRRPVRSRS